MNNNFNDTLSFQRDQQETAISIGAYLAPVKEFLDKAEKDISCAEDDNNIRQLHGHVANNSVIQKTYYFLTEHNYMSYFGTISSPSSTFALLLTSQLLPSQKKKTETFLEQMRLSCDRMAEGQIAIAQIPLPPHVDVNIKAKSGFQAYCFFTHFFSTVKEFLYIIDPYIDASIFHRYLYRLPKTTKIHIASSINGRSRIKREVETVENLFSLEYTNYLRKDFPDLHYRFLITETIALKLDGSLKDVAKKSDSSIVQISQDKKEELIKDYFS